MASSEVPSGKRTKRTSDCWPEVPEEERRPLEPVRIRIVRSCHFKKKPDGKRGCARCGEAKNATEHLGTPGSLNVFGSGANKFVFQNDKARWEKAITERLEETDLPKGLGRILVEGRVCFGDRTQRDQGNYRFMLEKACGDALVTAGWLFDDTWDRYEFGNLERLDLTTAEPQIGKGDNWTELVFLPSWDRQQAAVGDSSAAPGDFSLF